MTALSSSEMTRALITAAHSSEETLPDEQSTLVLSLIQSVVDSGPVYAANVITKLVVMVSSLVSGLEEVTGADDQTFALLMARLAASENDGNEVWS